MTLGWVFSAENEIKMLEFISNWKATKDEREKYLRIWKPTRERFEDGVKCFSWKRTYQILEVNQLNLPTMQKANQRKTTIKREPTDQPKHNLQKNPKEVSYTGKWVSSVLQAWTTWLHFCPKNKTKTKNKQTKKS